MSTREIILRVSATCDLKVRVGDKVRAGQRIAEGPETDGSSTAPAAGTVKSIRFDPGGHEFVIAITATA